MVATLFLLGTHFGIASTNLRAQVVLSIGERLYLALFSLVSVVAIFWLVSAWRVAPLVPLWLPGATLRALPFLLMPLVLLLFVCALSQPNPTAVGQEVDADATEPARGILRVTRHPLMWGIGLWGIGHMLAKGDLASILFFGALTALALVGTVLIDARRTNRNPPGWGVFLQRTSSLPFQAIVQGRQRLVMAEIGLTRVAAALGLYVALIWVHGWLFGAALF